MSVPERGRAAAKLARRGLVVGAPILAAVVLGGLILSPAQADSPAVYQWGEHNIVRPTVVGNLPNDIVAVQAANWGGMAIDGQGRVWDWGDNNLGELGDGRLTGSSWGRAVEAVGPAHVVSIGEGNDFAAAVGASGQVWVWGNNNHGQLCIGASRNSVTQPVKLRGIDAKQVSGGGYHLEILLQNGTVDTCGINEFGQLGDGTLTEANRPVAVEGLTNVVAVSSGDLFSSAMTSDGSVWTWGYNRYGQLGNGTQTNADVPQEVSLPESAKQIYAGGDYPTNGHMMVLLSDGTASEWGNNNCGQLGIGMQGSIDTTPQTVHVPSGVTFTSVAAGGADSFGIDQSGNLWAWGGGSPGELGNAARRLPGVSVQRGDQLHVGVINPDRERRPVDRSRNRILDSPTGGTVHSQEAHPQGTPRTEAVDRATLRSRHEPRGCHGVLLAAVGGPGRPGRSPHVVGGRAVGRRRGGTDRRAAGGRVPSGRRRN